MQYHHNGYRPGDPRVQSDRQPAKLRGFAELPEDVDVLIVGCGPAGLTLAAQLSQFSDIKTCIIEQKPGPIDRGQADGIACRTMEMFKTFKEERS